MSTEQSSEQLTLFAAGSLVSHSLTPGSDAARKTTAISGRKCCELSRHTGPLGCLVKMLLESSAWHSTLCFLIWKHKAINAKRSLFQLARSMPSTKGKEFTLSPDDGVRLWMTPKAGDADFGTPRTSGRSKRCQHTCRRR